MTQNRSLLLLVLVAVCAVAVAIRYLQTPIEPDVPTVVIDNGAPDRPTIEPATAGSPANTTGEQSTRVEGAGGDPTDERVCRVTVQLRNALQPALTIAHAEVHLYVGDDSTGGVTGDPVATGRTDGTGKAHFRLVGGHGRRAIADCGIGARAGAVLSATETTTITVELQPRVRVRGRVVDSSGIGVTGADIVLLRWPLERGDEATLWQVGQSGQNGDYDVYLRAGGRIGAMHLDYAPSAMFLVRPRRSGDGPLPVQEHDLMLLGRSVAVTGIVTNADGQPIAGARIDVRTTRSATGGADLAAPPRHSYSAADGTFTVEPLLPGQLRWSARGEGYGWQQGTLVARAGSPAELQIRLPWAAMVTGIAVDRQERPLAGARITAGGDGMAHRIETVSAENGTFALRGLGSGTVPLLAVHQDARAYTELTLQPGEAAQWRAVLIEADAQQTLTGRVVDEDDDPVRGWRVVVRQRGQSPRGTDTDDDGRFRIGLAADQKADVRVYAPDRRLTSFADAMQRDVDANRGPVILRVGKQVTGVVRGRVVTSTYNGAAATIGIWHNERREYARFDADAEGNFEIPAVPPGSIDLTFEHSGHSRYEHSLRMAPGAIADIGTIELAQAGALFGTVASTSGTVPDSYVISVLTSGKDRRRLVAEASAGSWRLPGVPPGKHTLLVEADGFASASFAVTVQKGDEQEFRIELLPGLRRKLRVQVPPGGGRRVSIALQQTGGGQPRWFATATVVREGAGQPGFAEFTTWMAAGSYQLRAWTDNGAEGSLPVRYSFDGEPDVQLQLTR